MTELEDREAGIDRMLRRSMVAPVPGLAEDFDERVLRKLRHRAPMLDRYRRILLACYGLISVVVSAVVMRGQGLDWGAIALVILAPLAMIGAAPWVLRTAHWIMRHGAN